MTEVGVMPLIVKVAPYTKSSYARLEAMIAALRKIDDEGIPGDVVECGVWRGGNIILARMLCPDRLCWLYDTFAGMTEPQDVDRKKSGARALDIYHAKGGAKWAAVSLDEVRDNLLVTNTLDDNRLRFVEGPVERTLVDPQNIPDKIALLRLDTDWHSSTKIELEVLYPRLQPGGVLIVDDYGHWQGARKAVNDYFAKAMPDMTRIDYTAVSMVKPC